MKRLRIFARTSLFGWKPCIYAVDVSENNALLEPLAFVCKIVTALSYTLT